MKVILIFGPTSRIALEVIRVLSHNKVNRFIFAGRSAARIRAVTGFVPAEQVSGVYETSFESYHLIDACIRKICGTHDVTNTLIFLGYRGEEPFQPRPRHDLIEILNINYLAVVSIVLSLASNSRGFNHVLHVGSINAFLARQEFYDYALAKRLAFDFMRLTRHRLKESKLRLTELVLGPVRGGMNEARKSIPIITVDLPGSSRIILSVMDTEKPIVFSSSSVYLITLISRLLPGLVMRRVFGLVKIR